MSSSIVTAVNYVAADGLNVFYRSAGPADAPVLLLLHGFPTSSHQYRNLITLLARTGKYRLIAPDLPGFGFTEVPESRKYEYSFVNIGKTLEAFVDALKLTKFALYVFDYGAPTGFYLALSRPSSITAIITQNGNAYEAGLGDAWAPIKAYWADGSRANREAIRGILSHDSIKEQYTSGVDASKYTIDPLGWTLDAALIARPGNGEIQLDLHYDYRNNVASYPRFHAFLRESKVPVLAVWGSNDAFFIPAGAEAYKQDVPGARVVFYETGHFALETHVDEIAKEIENFLG